MTALALSPLANHLWQSTICAAVAWLLAFTLRKNRASTRYWVWFAASAKFLIPFSLLISAGSRIPWPSAQAVAPPQVTLAIEQIGQPFSVPAVSPLVPVTLPPVNPLPVIMLAIWLCGVVAGVVFWARRLWRLRSIMRAAAPLDLDLPIPARESRERVEPGIVGIFRPVLLLPQGIPERLTLEQLAAIIAHEVRHLARRDNLTAAIHMLVETLFWFHPAIWFIRLRLFDERERACDEEVVAGGNEPQIYAESILKVCEHYLASPAPCAAGVTGGELRRRIEKIISNRMAQELSLGKKTLLVSAAALAFAIPLTVGLLIASRGDAQERQIGNAQPRPATGGATSAAQSATAATPSGARVPPVIKEVKFEVISIKPLKADAPGVMTLAPTPTGYRTNMALWQMIKAAYVPGLLAEWENAPLLNAPKWLYEDGSNNYAIDARVSREDMEAWQHQGPKRELLRSALRALLKERCKLVIHTEPKEVPDYRLVIAGKKHTMMENAPDPKLTPTATLSSGGYMAITKIEGRSIL